MADFDCLPSKHREANDSEADVSDDSRLPVVQQKAEEADEWLIHYGDSYRTTSIAGIAWLAEYDKDAEVTPLGGDEDA